MKRPSSRLPLDRAKLDGPRSQDPVAGPVRAGQLSIPLLRGGEEGGLGEWGQDILGAVWLAGCHGVDILAEVDSE